MKTIDKIFTASAATVLWVVIASAARGDYYLASICAVALLLIFLMALPDEPESTPRHEDDELLYLDRFEVLRREAAQKEAA